MASDAVTRTAWKPSNYERRHASEAARLRGKVQRAQVFMWEPSIEHGGAAHCVWAVRRVPSRVRWNDGSAKIGAPTVGVLEITNHSAQAEAPSPAGARGKEADDSGPC